ncbi:MAG TPA: endonuclease III domain-containing protein [Desulfurivibrio alkaliphilus]|uniref:Endonuclease III domain-containing protein n=1 Tax=Desulfurivibrio alkaliphilus TaxID=427923 RepID=A0A7C2TG30_9BACT|nr:endonuclease III domain-containing protein [Desulfurivibrio alkaliphilus]
MPEASLLTIYHRLLDFFGPQRWWPGQTPLEIMVGAVLTQNTAWGNVEKAIANLKGAELLPATAVDAAAQQACLIGLAQTPTPLLAALIRPAGYYNLKAGRLHNLIRRISDHHADLETFLARPTAELRRELLAIKGIGPETADSILLYAAGKPVFVVDAYTHRIFSRHQLLPEEADYHQIQEIFSDALPAEPQLYNEYHALIVRTGKEFCRKSNPRCPTCPLRTLPHAS